MNAPETAALFFAWFRRDRRHPWRKIAARRSEAELIDFTMSMGLTGDWLYRQGPADPNHDQPAQGRRRR